MCWGRTNLEIERQGFYEHGVGELLNKIKLLLVKGRPHKSHILLFGVNTRVANSIKLPFGRGLTAETDRLPRIYCSSYYTNG
uniref:Uncharacterized protein n=1 Tax=Hyaloperonospora arabidopsidis (strain Emoy2) TaxID=559515 RepID=M4BWH0_HYAAE